MKHLFTLLLIGTITFSANASDKVAGQKQSTSCFACHGKKGISNNPSWPNLAGQKEKYLEKQILAFRDGKRNDPMMNSMVKNLTNEDAANIAAYFSQLNPQ